MRRAVLTALTCLLSASPAAAAERDTAVALVGATELHVAPEFSGFGILLVQADIGDLRLRFNTDTLDVSWGGIPLDALTSLRVGMAGEAFIAGALGYHYVQGEQVSARGFAASWAGPYAEFTRRIGEHGFLGWRSMARQWWFGTTRDPLFAAPENFASIEQKMSLTYWGFESDPSLYEAHRLFRRLRGFGAGVQGEFWWRGAAADWGDPADGRNLARRRNFAASQWAALGVQFGNRRLQLEERAHFGADEDDLNRASIGGFNPYMFSLAGVGSPAFRASRAVSGSVSIHQPIGGDTEVGLASDAVILDDPFRDGTDEFGGLAGISAFLDLRRGAWQGDLHFGWTFPSPVLARAPQLGIFIAIGRSL